MADNKGYEFKKLNEAEEITQLQDDDNIVVVNKNDTYQISPANFVNEATDRAFENVVDTLKNVEFTEDPINPTALIVDEEVDPETGETTKVLKRTTSSGGKETKWYTMAYSVAMYGSGTMFSTLEDLVYEAEDMLVYVVKGSDARVEIREAYNYNPEDHSCEYRGFYTEFNDDIVVKVNGAVQTLGTDYTYRTQFEDGNVRTTLYFKQNLPQYAEVTLTGTLPLVPGSKVYEGSDYLFPDKHDGSVLVPPEVFTEIVKSNKYNIMIKPTININSSLMKELVYSTDLGIGMFLFDIVTTVSNLVQYSLSNIELYNELKESMFLYDNNLDIISTEDYSAVFDDENHYIKITFSDKYSSDYIIGISTKDQLEYSTYGPLDNSVNVGISEMFNSLKRFSITGTLVQAFEKSSVDIDSITSFSAPMIFGFSSMVLVSPEFKYLFGDRINMLLFDRE